MVCKDEVALILFEVTMRMKLLRSLVIHKESAVMKKMEPLLSPGELDIIYSKSSAFGRSKDFIDVISKRLTTGLFIAFVNAVDDEDLLDELLNAYEAQGSCIKTLVQII